MRKVIVLTIAIVLIVMQNGQAQWAYDVNNNIYTNSYVGIGKTNPSTFIGKFEVHQLTSNNTSWASYIYNCGSSGKGLLIKSGYAYTPILQLEDVSAAIKFKVLANGNVGIGTGTVNPTNKLDIIQNSSTNWGAYIYNSNGDGKGLKIKSGYWSVNTATILQLEDVESNVRFKVTSNGVVYGDKFFSINGDIQIGNNMFAKASGGLTFAGSIGDWAGGWAPYIQAPIGSMWVTNNKTIDQYYLGFGMTNSGWFFAKKNDAGTLDYPAWIDLSGKLTCTEVVITLDTWKDIVFEPDYKLLSLKEVESYIQHNGHLPEIPSTSEMLETGLETSEMIKLQMQKIEELTLYVIEQQKSIDKLIKLSTEQQETIDVLKEEVKQLKNK